MNRNSKKSGVLLYFPRNLQKIMKISVVIFLTGVFFVQMVNAHSQETKLTINEKASTITGVCETIEKESSYRFVFTGDARKIAANKTVDIAVTEREIEEVLEAILLNTDLKYRKLDNQIVVYKENSKEAINNNEKNNSGQFDQQVSKQIKGKVVDEEGEPVIGATIRLKSDPTKGVATDLEGNFILSVPLGETLVVSYVGMKSQEIKAEQSITIVLVPDTEVLGELVVTGIFERKKENFTGSSKTFTGDDLKSIGNQNVMTSLKTLDPSFVIVDNNLFGSDPNRLPDVEIRGKTSIIGLSQEFSTDPNQPLFILDGFESSLQVIADLSMDRVESITLLKDASATAIYGSKAANGVVVVETKRPKPGKLILNYNANLKLNFADLSSYNLMNSSEKLQFEKLSGFYGPLDSNGNLIDESPASSYYQRLAEVERGVDTYWMGDPLRYGFSQGHNLFAEGGDDQMRYGVGLSYSGTEGVMKGSNRDVINGNIRLIYRWKKFSFTESISIDNTDVSREMVPFSDYSHANPYYRKYNEDDEVYKILESNSVIGGVTNIYNPLYNASLNNFNKTSGLSFRNNFEAEWRPTSELRARGRFGFNKGNQIQKTFYSPFNTMFEETERSKKGSFNEKNTVTQNMDADLSLTYGKLFNKRYMVNAVGGTRLSSMKAELSGYEVSGFLDDSKPNPSFSNGYTENSRPAFSNTKSRSVSYYFNAGFSADNKYLMDISLRSDGSSIFGVNNKFTNTWSVGLGWNASYEGFMKDVKFFDYLKFRGSVGNPGNQNFDAGMIYNTYTYNSNYQNMFGLSSFITSFGNKNLEWQKTLDANIGVDLEMLNNRLRLNFDIYKKTTDPLLIYIDVPTSTGTSQVPFNAGSNESTGLSFLANYTIIKKQDFNWQVNTNGRVNNSKYKDIGKLLDNFNSQNLSSRSLNRFYDNGSPTDLWAVRSAGIDPATGREIFIKKDGSHTFTFDYADEVIVGNSNPNLEGVVGTTLYFKKLSFSFYTRYKFGGDTFLSALYDKVENISDNSIRYNQDKRALYDRWQKPGDVAKYKAISLTDQTQMSSRFVVEENTISGESISLGYQSTDKKLHDYGLSSVNFRVYLNDIFRISTVKNERGISYPFERSISFSVGFRLL